MAKPKKEIGGVGRRREVLREVERCVCQDRQASYGDAEDNFANIASVANVVLKRKLKVPLDPLDVALFMASLKLVRAGHNPQLDSLVDLAGYAVCGGGILLAKGGV